MNYWWVNQSQTFRQEIGNGYMWSPQKQKNNTPHFSYEFMKNVQPGDIIFSYANSSIIAIGIAKTRRFSFPKPEEFINVGLNWSNEGWRVNVDYTFLEKPLRTKDHIREFRPFLPRKYSPIRYENGYANQAYLFKISKDFALAILHLINHTIVDLINVQRINDIENDEGASISEIESWENEIQLRIEKDKKITNAEKIALKKARIGQGRFRREVLNREHYCRVTGVSIAEHLVASHIKPWRSSSNLEKLDPENGFMLTHTIDHLFDQGFISFENTGKLILSDFANRKAMSRMGVINRTDEVSPKTVSEQKKEYLEWHREKVLL